MLTLLIRKIKFNEKSLSLDVEVALLSRFISYDFLYVDIVKAKKATCNLQLKCGEIKMFPNRKSLLVRDKSTFQSLYGAALNKLLIRKGRTIRREIRPSPYST